MPDDTPHSAICRVEDGPLYRGYPLADLAANCRFEEVAYLLVHGDLPTRPELAAFEARGAMSRRLPEPLRQLFESLPTWAAPLDALRTAVSALGHFDQDHSDDSPEANRRKAERLIAQSPVAVFDFWRASRGLRAVPARQELSHAANVLAMARGGEPTGAEVRALDVALIVAAEYEFNAPAYAARVVSSTGAGLYAAVAGAVGALRGARAEAATELVLTQLRAAANAATVEGWALEAFQAGGVAGFGRQVDSSGDARAEILKMCVRELAGDSDSPARELEDLAERIEGVAAREYGLTPTIAWPSARLYSLLGFDGPLFPALFAVARVAGWCAHAIEQAEAGGVIRPRATYTGPNERRVVPPAGRS